jgi:hypothetical protein
MKTSRYVTIFALLNALAFSVAHGAAQGAQAKGHSSKRGGEAATHMSPKGQANTNAQWYADPVHGWMRAEERHELHESHASKGKAKKAGAERKGKASKGSNK